MTQPKFVKWIDYPVGRKHRVFNQLELIGAKLIIVFNSWQHKNGLSMAVSHYNERTRRLVRINYISAHVAEVELCGV